MTAIPAHPRTAQWLLGIVVLLMLASAFAIDWNLEAFASFEGLQAALGRMSGYLSAFLQPDLSSEMLAYGLRLSLETLSVALLGTALGLLLAWPIAMLASRSAMLDVDEPPSFGRSVRRIIVELARLVLDILRGVPDFAWAIVFVIFTGLGPVTGILAIGVSVAGILGKVLSEQWDNIDPANYSALRSTGASRLQTFLYGIQPLAARSTMSFVLMRAECAARNASVIGVVGGGGLGAALWNHFDDGRWPRVTTILLFMLAVTLCADLAANLLRYQLRSDPNHPRAPRSMSARDSSRRRILGTASVAAILVACAAYLAEPIARATESITQLEWPFISNYTTSLLLLPDLSLDALGSAARQSIVPLALAVLGTGLAVVLAAALAFPASIAFQIDAAQFTGENLPLHVRLRRWLLVLGSRCIALVLRGVPEVAWVVLLGMFFKQGVTPCVFAVALHSTGVLHRVFTETLDNVPYRQLEQVSGGCRPHVFLYGGLPAAWRDWKTYAFFQFEVNVRIGVVLGMVGAGGLGDAFRTNLEFRDNHRAGTFLWAMVLLTIGIDRLSRRLLLVRKKC